MWECIEFKRRKITNSLYSVCNRYWIAAGGRGNKFSQLPMEVILPCFLISTHLSLSFGSGKDGDETFTPMALRNCVEIGILDGCSPKIKFPPWGNCPFASSDYVPS
jgi:hypothetical protein